MKKIIKITFIVTILTVFFSSFCNTFAAENKVDISKSATELDEKLQTEVTLTVPTKIPKIKRDIVLILDASDCISFTQSSLVTLLKDIKEEIQGTNEEIKVGVVVFKGNATSLGWKDINDFDAEDIVNQVDAVKASGELASHGTNIPSAFLAAQDLLKADTDVTDDKKTVFFLSDGITYLFTKNRDCKTDYDVSLGLTKGPEDRGYGDLGKNASEWQAIFDSIEANYPYYVSENSDDDYAFSYSGCYTKQIPDLITMNKILPDSPVEGSTRLINNVEMSLYQANLYYQELVDKYSCYAIRVGEINETYKWGKDFMDYLAESNASDYSEIGKEFLNLISEESYIYDEIGKSEDFDFDIINAPEMFNVCSNDGQLPRVQISENEYGFGEGFEKDGKIYYPYELEYHPETDNEPEHLIWKINKIIKEYNSIEFKYNLKLKEYKDGVDLYTNNKAILYTNNGDDTYNTINFEKPVLQLESENTNENENSENNETENKSNNPKAGDAIIISVGVLAIACISILVIRKKQQNNK